MGVSARDFANNIVFGAPENSRSKESSSCCGCPVEWVCGSSSVVSVVGDSVVAKQTIKSNRCK